MATDVTLPALGESVTEGTVTQWLKSVGDEVAVDEPLLEVSTDKVDTEIPSPVAGKLLEIKAEQDETIEVGAVLAVIGDSNESSSTSSSDDGGSADESEQDQSGDQAKSSDSSDESDEPAEEPSEDEASGDESQTQDEEPSDESQAQDEGSSDESQGQDEGSTDESADESASEKPSSEQAPTADASPAGDGDATEVKLPALGESVTEGTVTQWLKSVGDDVSVDEPLLEVSTDKVDTEIPSPVAGKLLEIKAEQDETIEVGAVLALIGAEGAASSGGGGDDSGSDESHPTEQEPTEQEPTEQESAQQEPEAEPEPEEQPAAKEEAQPEPQRATQEPAQQHSSAPSSADAGDTRSYVTPLVRKLAAQHGVELAALSGTGVGGRIRKQDVLEAAVKAEEAKKSASAPAASAASTAAPAAPSPELSALRGKTEKLSRLRKVIAARMVESLQVSAQLTTVVEVDVTAISRLRDRVKANFEQREGVKLSFLPFFAKASIDALKTYPQVNASIDTEAGEVTYHDGEHLGVAVDTERGLLVPVIKDAGDLSIAGLARKIADLATRTRDSKISPDELSGGTFTLTNTGSRGALFDTPIINQPQVAILGTGTVVKRAVVISDPNLGETIAIRQMVYLALTYDHRLVDGADAARFLSTIKQRLEEANFESELGI